MEPQPISRDQLFSQYPSPWPEDDLRRQIRQLVKESGRCVVALDDDPTGTQTVHDIWVLTSWKVSELRRALQADEQALYILTNSRSVNLATAQKITREVAVNLANAAHAEKRTLTVVSRSDSTLRGHYPGEVDALEEALLQGGMGPFSGVCIIPFFPEGGRYTAGDIHWVQDGELLIPAAQTPYANDPIFGYQHSRLPEWVEEKTQGRVRASEVVSITIDTLRRKGPKAVTAQLIDLKGRSVIIVNALSERDLEVFVLGLLAAEDKGKRFLFRTAAGFIKVASGLEDRELLQKSELVKEDETRGGLIIFGSHVPRSSEQLQALLSLEGIGAVELPVESVLDQDVRQRIVTRIAETVDSTIDAGTDAVVYTSRRVITGRTSEETLEIARQISLALMEVVQHLSSRPKYLIGKGGITSSDLATIGLNVTAARVLGQIYPGVPVWLFGQSSRWPGLSYIVFPGNVGQPETVKSIVAMLRR